MPKPELEFFSPDFLPWQPDNNVEGLYEKILALDPETGSYTRLLRFEPDTDTSAMGVLQHEFWEEVWIISGEFRDVTLNMTFTAGMYACRPPGMKHGPWISTYGCTTFEIRTYMT